MKSQSKQTTLEDVAKYASVSIKTVSRVINNERYVGDATRQRVAKAIKELDYHPNRAARRLASKRSNVIGMLMPSIDYPIFPVMILGVEKVMHKHNYEVLVYSTEVSQERARKGLELLAENQVDGILSFTVNDIVDDELHHYLNKHQEVVLVNNMVEGSRAGIVRADVAYGIELVVEHLLQSGRKRIALLTYDKATYSAVERLKGYKHALAKFNLPLDQELIIICEDKQSRVFDKVQDVLKTGEPEVDAMICYNDLMAATVLRACFDLGVSVPDDVAITGFDNIPFTDLFKCALTTVNVDWFEMGVIAAEMLLGQLNGEEFQQEIILTPELVIRESTP